MTLGIMQAYFFPYIGYFQLINAVDKFMIYEHVSFRKRSWITRNRLLDKATGAPYFINAQVKNSSSNKSIGKTELLLTNDWKNSFLKRLVHNYSKAEYFDQIFPLIENCVSCQARTIHEFNSHSIALVAEFLAIDTPIVTNNSNYLSLENELVNVPAPKVKTERILSICKTEGAQKYINPIGGMEIYDKTTFSDHGINLVFTKSKQELPYSQFNHAFVPNLSIIDLLMHEGLKGVQNRLNNFELV